VERAAAAVREAFLALQRTELPAPVAGQVARRTVQVGQRLAAGTPLMSLVPLDQVWVEANFKEVQLRRMRIGQPVTLRADLYGSQVEFRGRVAGLGAGTGAAFALLPAQNATGNWIKVVQRVPVRVEIDPRTWPRTRCAWACRCRPRWTWAARPAPRWPRRPPRPRAPAAAPRLPARQRRRRPPRAADHRQPARPRASATPDAAWPP
jgi:pyruvate/2-oxoglutarate dehydrogenase complex dihydrolipoamide acyltransferase (E2) component